jgi:hypothetical protein
MTIPSDSVPFPGATPSEGAPRPWKVVPYVDAIRVVDANGASVLSLSDRPTTDFGSLPPDNARLIVAAVNSYDALRTESDALAKEVQRLREAGEADLLELARSVVSEWQKYLDDDGVMHPGRAIYDAIAQLASALK